MEYGYARGSTDAQDGQGQIHRLTEAGISRENIYMDMGVSGMRPAASRPEFARMAAMLVPGDRVTVPELSRLGRNVADVLGTVESFETQDVALRILDLGVDSKTAGGRMVLGVIACLGRMERDLISERTRAALQARKAAGVKLGAKPKLSDGQAATVATMKNAGMSMDSIATALGISKRSAYNYLSRARDAA